MLRFRQKWPDAAECCGREVQTNRLGRKKAWWAQGTAIEKFEEDIQPEIETFLKNADLNDGDIYFRIYMIGRTQEASRPTVMICCADVSIGRRAKESLRHSPVIRNNPGFCLGSIDFPLEQLVPARGLALEVKPLGQVLDNASDPTAGIPIFAISDSATVGRRLFVTHPETMEVYRHSTGGVVVTNNGRFYQLTVGHIVDLPIGVHQPSRMDPDACSFDGQSDSDSGDDLSVCEQDLRRASVSILDLSQSESSDAETEKTEADTAGYRSPANTDYTTTNSDPIGFSRNEGLKQPSMIEVGTIAVHSKDGDAPSLDYALVAIPPPSEVDQINRVLSSTGDETRPTMIHDVTGVGREERRVIVITGSSGVVKGILVPGTTFLGRGNQKGPQKLHVVQLDGVVAEGDSGAAVVDEMTGSLYGHMVSGCPGTRIAYIVAATDVFKAIESELHGQLTIASQMTSQELSIQSSTISSLFSTSNSVLGMPDQLPNYTTLDESRGSSGPSGGQGNISSTTDCVSMNGRPDVQFTASRYSVLDAQINKLQTKVESLATASQSIEQHISYRRRKKTKKAGFCQQKQPRARQGARFYRPSVRGFDNELEGESTFSPPKEKSQTSIQRAMGWDDSLFEEDMLPHEEDESLLTLLFDRYQFDRRINPEGDFIPKVYNCCSIRELQRATYLTHSEKSCFLDDRTNDGMKSVSLGHHGPLSVQSLYQTLRVKPLYPLNYRSPALGEHKLALPGQETISLNADRRLIYIQDVDSYGIALLIATASYIQAKALGNVFYRYLDFQPGISVSTVSLRGHFHMFFCLPTYVWRSTPRRPYDIRLKRSGQPIRNVRDISFLRTGSVSKSHSGDVDYLCEVQTSISITGIDRWHWTGLCLVETQFQEQDQYQDLNSYCNQDPEDSLRPDPFSDGELDADRPILDPREYFLAVLDIRARRFQQHWHELTRVLQTLEFRTETVFEERADFNEALIWIRQTKRLLHSLIRCLNGTINHWDNARITDKCQSNYSTARLTEIAETFSNVKLNARELESLSSLCDEFSRQVSPSIK
ncbi:hypothetical protein NW752_002283 [Fusarium irregulare]|nr:hypothetical protein NW752_002283 [Fusarium irregulare]